MKPQLDRNSYEMVAVTERSLWQHCLVLATAVTDLSELLSPETIRNVLTMDTTGFILHMCLRVAIQEVCSVLYDVVADVGILLTTMFAMCCGSSKRNYGVWPGDTFAKRVDITPRTRYI